MNEVVLEFQRLADEEMHERAGSFLELMKKRRSVRDYFQ